MLVDAVDDTGGLAVVPLLQAQTPMVHTSTRMLRWAYFVGAMVIDPARRAARLETLGHRALRSIRITTSPTGIDVHGVRDNAGRESAGSNRGRGSVRFLTTQQSTPVLWRPYVVPLHDL